MGLGEWIPSPVGVFVSVLCWLCLCAEVHFVWCQYSHSVCVCVLITFTWASLIGQLERICLQCIGDPDWIPGLGRSPGKRDRVIYIPVFLGFPCGSAGKESACNVGDLGLSPLLGRSPGKGKVYPLDYSGLENSMDCTVHGVTVRHNRGTFTSHLFTYL